jgi:hypothetical protein
MLNKDVAEVGDLIRIVDPVWDWLKEGDIGVILKRKKWAGLDESGTKTADRYNYKVRFATSNQTRIINRREFEIISSNQV